MVFKTDKETMSKYPRYIAIKTRIYELSGEISNYDEGNGLVKEPSPYYGKYPCGYIITDYTQYIHGDTMLGMFKKGK